LTFLVGKIGSGKTALLNAIQNEMKNIFEKENKSVLDSMIDSKTIKLKEIE
jgi:chromosomal replication initiation ATPase DnaA